MDITDRLIDVCKNKKIKNIDLVHLGCGSQQTVSFILNGKQKPNSQFIETFLKAYPDVDARWLFTGENQDVVQDVRFSYGFCKECIKKEGVIEHLKKEIAAKDKRIEQFLLKFAEAHGGDGCQTGSKKDVS